MRFRFVNLTSSKTVRMVCKKISRYKSISLKALPLDFFYLTDRNREILLDGIHYDCMTDTHAIEFDFGKYWAEGVWVQIC